MKEDKASFSLCLWPSCSFVFALNKGWNPEAELPSQKGKAVAQNTWANGDALLELIMHEQKRLHLNIIPISSFLPSQWPSLNNEFNRPVFNAKKGGIKGRGEASLCHSLAARQ
jgi:hypothetical protein